jgi:hypothetical protein
MELGRVIRAHKMNTTIGQLPVLSDGRPRKGLCGSACTFAFVGGVLRDAGTEGSVYAVHRFSLQDPGPDAISLAQQINAEMLTYLTFMGIDLRLIALMGQVPKESLQRLSPQEMANLKIIRLAKVVTRWEVIPNNPVTIRGITEGKDGRYTLDFQCVSPTSALQTSAPVRQLFLTVNYKDKSFLPSQIRIHPVTVSGTSTRFELSAEEFEPPNPAIVQMHWDVGVSLRIKMSPRMQALVLNEPELGILLGRAEPNEFALVRSMQSDLSEGKQLLQGFFANCR